MTDSELMTLREVAKYLKIDALTVHRLIQKKKIPAYKVGGQWRFKKERLDKWLEDHENIKK